ncbi:rhamnogalacturonan acetylesterase [Paraliobacillus sediminis]|uniref:rhamnogalacturonan acetylesterase n=1 Tax=Paraliobacillus sediminis TaxID=1885916 RepID=UPI000E3E2027|nr:rhamnogalacturonan acetylesterase [Paraliobacillus sediminis]
MEQITIYLVGDSTVSSYDTDEFPMTGWGQMLSNYFNEGITICNAAIPGYSSKSFIDDGKLEAIRTKIKPNDYLFIQFGHNDQKPDIERHTDPFTTYKNYLREYIEVARNNKAIPVLITPVQRRKFSASGEIENTHGEYSTAMKQLAVELNVPLIDLTLKSKKLFESLGDEKSKKLFLWCKPSEYKNYPEGAEDNTHFHQFGADQIAKLIIEGIEETGLTVDTKLSY